MTRVTLTAASTWLVLVALVALQTQALLHSPPQIIKQPPTDELLFKVATQSNDKDKPFLVECEAEGEPAPKYRWVKNGKHFDWQAYDNRISQEAGRGTLLISAPRDEDLGQYQCFAENEHGVATSNSVFVRRAELNNFKDEQLKSIQVNEGEPFKLQCSPPDGWPKPIVYWIQRYPDGNIRAINSSRITVDPEGNLWFSNVTRQDASSDFYYVCSASSLFLNEFKVSSGTLMNVVQTGISPTQNRQAPTRQYTTRKNELAMRGKGIELYCIFGGTPLPQTVWKKDGSTILWSDRVTQGHYGKTLHIKRVSFEDRGSYTCEASNGVGSVQSYSINLEVEATPYFTVEPEAINAAEDEDAEFKCEATGEPRPTIKWIHNGKPIAQAPANDRRVVGANSIFIRKLNKKDTGNYGCNATNSHGYVYKDVYLNVLALQPEIKEPPLQEQTVDGRNVTLTCRVFGAPKPEVKWIRNNLELTGGRYRVQEKGDLLVENVGFADAGNYTCHAQNKFGTAEAHGSLIVREHTRITDEPQDYEVAAGRPATFRCNAIADSSLDLQISWLFEDQEIEFENQPRFVRTNDNSLTISKTAELDSGIYTCRATTYLDEAQAQATLTVQDVPNAPRLTGIDCNTMDAAISWEALGDNRAPILHYTIQYNTSFTPDTWQVAFDKVPATDFTYTVAMSPWSNYTFRIVAFNKIGSSLPSGPSQPCTTHVDVPYKNPDNVEGKGTTPTNLIISWTHMPEIEHNAPHFHYRVNWKRDIPTEEWQYEDVRDWEQSSIEVKNQPTFQRYRIRVVALNEQGESNMAAKEVIGWSGEDRPTQAPTNFTLLQVTDAKTALLSWNPVPAETVRGHFKGYIIQTWTEAETEANLREIHVKDDSSKALVNKFTPNAQNFARVLVYNSRFNGPASAVIDFQTPEGLPSSVQSLEALPLGSSAFMLSWKRPLQPNGVLTGYKIYYEMVNGTRLENKQEREPHIDDARVVRAKLAGLKADTKYRIHITATTKAGEGEDYFIEHNTLSGLAAAPSAPSFAWDRQPTNNGLAQVRINWLPDHNGHSGSHFFAKYRVKGQSEWLLTEHETQNDYLTVRALNPDTEYEFRVMSVDGEYMTESQTQVVDTYGIEGPLVVRSENVATAGWFIGMMLAIVFLLLLMIIICILKRNRGGKYDVHDREVAAGRRDYEEGGFHEYPQATGRHSIASNLTRPEGDDDGDSLAEYGEGDTVQFTEDGSFIGQYVPPPISPQSQSHQPHHPAGAAGSPLGVSSVATYV